MSKQIKMPSGLWITPKQKENLEILAAGLLTVQDPEEFNMEVFFDSKDVSEARGGDDYPSEAKYHCGTAACAVGHAPLFGIKPYKEEDWFDYAARVFGVGETRFKDDVWDSSGFRENQRELADQALDWMFAGDWRTKDNTPRGAAARIKWFLTYGVPRDMREQQGGKAPLSYQLLEQMEVPEDDGSWLQN